MNDLRSLADAISALSPAARVTLACYLVMAIAVVIDVAVMHAHREGIAGDRMASSTAVESRWSVEMRTRVGDMHVNGIGWNLPDGRSVTIGVDEGFDCPRCGQPTLHFQAVGDFD